MACMTCGFAERAEANFCSHCGCVMCWRGFPGYSARLVRPQESRMVAGVCAGLAEHYGWDVSLVRVLLALSILCTGLPLVAYLIAWIVIPNAPYRMPMGMPVTPQPTGTMGQ